jgi:Glyoxalase-like domain
MTTVIKAVSFDAADALALAVFWAAVFGSDVDEDSSADKAFVEAAGWGGPNIWFTRVPEAKAAKNRMHFDLRAPGAVADEVVRLEKLGATVLERHQHHTVMQDRKETSSASNPAQHTCRTRNDGRIARTLRAPAVAYDACARVPALANGA